MKFKTSLKITAHVQSYLPAHAGRDPCTRRARLLKNAELAALESLASPSSVEKEKAQLAMMKAALQESLGKVCAIRYVLHKGLCMRVPASP